MSFYCHPVIKPLNALIALIFLSPVAGFADQTVDLGTVSSQASGSDQPANANSNPVQNTALNQDTVTLDQEEIQAGGVVGGAARALAIAPGVSVASYGSSGATKTSISIDGIKTGWAGFSGGQTDNGSIGVTFDGVPMVNPGNGLWQATLVPQSSMIDSMSVTYGPGDPADRWYTNIGGGINFKPLQPSNTASATADYTFGSFNTRNFSASLQTGDHGGWATVLAFGEGKADSFMTAPDGFGNGSSDQAYYMKTRKKLDNGQFSIGMYHAFSGAFRPLATPTTPISDVTLNGYDSNNNSKGGPLFSQQTTGFYTTLPGNVNWKWDTNDISMLYGNLDLNLNSATSFHNMTYYTHEERLHYTPLHAYYPVGGPGQSEVNAPSSDVVGDKLWVSYDLPMNHLEAGGYLQGSHYHSQEQLFSPAASASAPDGNYFSDQFYQMDTAAFIEDQFAPVKSLRINPGIRFVDYYVDFTHDEAAQFPNATGTNLSMFPSATKSFNKFEPSLGINWDIMNGITLYANYERAYRLPEMGGGTGPFVAITAPNVQLEQGDYYQAGGKMHWNQLGLLHDTTLDASIFNLKFANETLPTALASGGALLASGSSTYSGMNLAASSGFGSNLFGFMNVGLVTAKYNSFTNGSGTLYNVPVANTPHTTVSTGITGVWMIGSATVKPRLVYQYTGAQHIYDNNANQPSTTELSAYGLVNFNAELDLQEGMLFGKPNFVTVNLEVDNLLNKQYNAFEYVSAGGLYGTPNSVGATLALPGAPRAVMLSIGDKF